MSGLSVSLVIPVRDRQALLPRLFASVEAVDYAALDILLVDNGSADSSLSLCQAFAARSRHSVSVLQEPLPGANHARNCGLRSARGQWVYFFDSDDELSPDFLSALMPRARQGADLIAFPTRMEWRGKVRVRDFVPSSSVAAQVISGTLNTQGVIWRTAFLRSVGGWNESLSVWQDWELAVRALSRSPEVVWCPARAFHLIHLSVGGITATTGPRERYRTLLSVLPLMKTSSDVQALYYRLQILRAQTHTRMVFPAPISFKARLVGTLLRLYTLFRGRGAWRVALRLTR